MNKKLLCSILVVFIFISNVFASTTTYERSLDNLQIASDIIVTTNNKTNILNTPKVNETEKIYDFADVFTDLEEIELYNEISEFINNTNLDMVLVSINENNKISSREYAEDFYDYNYFGVGDTHDGLLFLIDMDNREMFITTSGNSQIIYDNYRIDRILDATYDKISNEKYYECAVSFIENSKYYFNLGIPDSNKNVNINDVGDYVYNDTYEVDFTFFIVPFVITLVIIFIMKGQHKTIRKATNALAYMKEKNISYREDTFLTTNTVKVYDPPSSSRSSGGGSSTYRGSSGRSHGGGGRRF